MRREIHVATIAWGWLGHLTPCRRSKARRLRPSCVRLLGDYAAYPLVPLIINNTFAIHKYKASSIIFERLIDKRLFCLMRDKMQLLLPDVKTHGFIKNKNGKRFRGGPRPWICCLNNGPPRYGY